MSSKAHGSTGGVLLNGRYQLLAKLGHGSFGDIYKAVDIEAQREVGIKFERVRCLKPQLKHEYSVMKLLSGHSLSCAHTERHTQTEAAREQEAFRSRSGSAQRATTTRL